jgi:hypothetical protein
MVHRKSGMWGTRDLLPVQKSGTVYLDPLMV